MIMEKVLQYVLLYICSALLPVCDSDSTARTIDCRPDSSVLSGGLAEGHIFSSCQRSDSCFADHQPDLEETQCQQQYNHTPINSLNNTMCPASRNGVPRHCNAFTEHEVTESQYFLVTNLSASVLSLDSHHFAINVSWNHQFRPDALSKPRPGRQLVGYEIRLLRQDNDGSVEHMLCWCVWETNVSSVILGLNHSLMYHPSGKFEVRFLSLPYAYPINAYMPNPFNAGWPSGCSSKDITSQHPLYGKPRNVKVVSSTSSGDNKELKISWSHPATPPPTLAPPPSLYYVHGTSIDHNFTVLANRTCNVVISHLKPTQDYIIRVQAYVDCSSLSANLTGTGQRMGCGDFSEPVPELQTSPPILKVDTDSDSFMATTPDTITAAVTDGGLALRDFPGKNWLLPVLPTALVGLTFLHS